MGLKLYTIFIYNVRFLKVCFGGDKSGPGGGGGSAVTKEKERRKRKSEGKGGEEKKSNGCTLSFIMVTWRSKKTVRRKRSILR